MDGFTDRQMDGFKGAWIDGCVFCFVFSVRHESGRKEGSLPYRRGVVRTPTPPLPTPPDPAPPLVCDCRRSLSLFFVFRSA